MKEDFKRRIVRENMDLPPHEIKKILKKRYPDIKNEDIENLILNVNNPNRNIEQDNDENER